MHILTFLKGAALGVGLMYLFDPSRGRTRRARIRDKAVRVWNDTGDAIEGCTHDLANRTQGLLHDAASVFSPGSNSQQRIAPRSSPRWAPANWSPSTRLLVTAGASMLALYGKRRGDALGAAMGAASVAIITSSISATDLRRGFDPAPALPADYSAEGDEDHLSSGESWAAHQPRISRSP